LQGNLFHVANFAAFHSGTLFHIRFLWKNLVLSHTEAKGFATQCAWQVKVILFYREGAAGNVFSIFEKENYCPTIVPQLPHKKMPPKGHF
jgi:hypothetical protein